MHSRAEDSNYFTSPDMYRATSQENQKYAFHSPQQMQHPFPTPYSLNQNKQEHAHALVRDASDVNDCSLVDNSMLNHHNQVVANNSGSSLSHASMPSSASGHQNNEAHSAASSSLLPDINEQPSSMLHFGNFANELMLASPEQFKEFLMDSPAGLNLWQQRNTPAKTPLKFVTNTSNLASNPNTSMMHQMTSPLQNIDINLMFNSVSKQSISPSRKQMSLTPYGRRILNEMGTPFTKILQPTSSNNSALVDFHRARKQNLQSTPTSRPNLRNESPGSRLYGSSPTTIQLNSSGTKCSPQRDPNIDEKLFHLRASPTPKLSINKTNNTLQLPSKLELPRMGSFKGNILSSSPTASSRILSSKNQRTINSHSIINVNNKVRNTSQHSNSNLEASKSQYFTSDKVRKPKLKRNGNKNKLKSGQLMTKQRFQIIMTDTTSFNSDDGLSQNSNTKLKRSQSVIIPEDMKRKKKKKKADSNIIPNSQ